MSVRFAIGIGARRGVGAEEIVALVRHAAEQAGVESGHGPRTLGRAPSPRLRGEGTGEGPLPASLPYANISFCRGAIPLPLAGEGGPAKPGRVRATAVRANGAGPHPTLADARATFSRKREKEAPVLQYSLLFEERVATYALFTIDTKRDEPGFHEAARLLETQIVFLPLALLEARKNDGLTRSARVEGMMGVGSVAETAALAGAGPGSKLLAPRIATGRMTCAIARACANAMSEAP